MKLQEMGRKMQKKGLKVEESAIPYWKSLPLELLTEIFSHLGSKSLIRVAGVCKLWRTAAQSDIVMTSLVQRYSGYLPLSLSSVSLQTINDIQTLFAKWRKESASITNDNTNKT